MTRPTLLPGGFYQRVAFKTLRSRLVPVCLAVFAAFSCQAADVLLYSVTKGTRHIQTSDVDVNFLPLDEFVFKARVLCLSNTVISAFVEATNYIDRVLAKQDPEEWAFDADDNNRHDLNARFPDGRYSFYIRTVNDGYRPNLPLTLRATNVTVPQIRNFTELQSASGTGFVQVSWAPFTNGTTADSIQLRIEDRFGVRAFETRDFGEFGALDGTATNALIEPGNLKPGTTYFAWLEFRKTIQRNTTSYPGATGWSYVHRRTEFTIHTAPDPILDLEAYTVCKGRHYVQTNTNPPILEGNGTNGYVFSASIELTSSNVVLITNRIIAPNGNTTNAFPEDCRPETQSEFSYTVSSQTGLDTQFPDGTYRVEVTTSNQGSRSMPLSLVGADYPPMPYVLNFDPSLPVRTNDALEIRWAPWVGGRATDYIQLRLLTECRTVYETGDFGDNDALNGYATNAIIPAGVMTPGVTYRATLTFRRFTDLDFTTYLGAAGIACYYSRLKFDVTALLDVQGIELAKGRRYVQTNSVDVVPDGTNAFEFFAVVDAQTPQSVTNATLTLPDNSQVPLIAAPGDDEFAFQVASSNSLDSAYPAGEYTFDVGTLNDGARAIALDLSPLAYPPAPRFLHDPGMRLPEDQTNHIAWERWSGGTSNDFVQFRIRNAGTNVWETPDLGEEGALTGESTDAYIPPGVLSRGVSYSGRLIFRRTVDTNTAAYPGATALAYYFSETQIDLRTIRPDMALAKGRRYVQTNSVDVVADGTNAFEFLAAVDARSPQLLTNATLTLPDSSQVQLLAAPDGDEFIYEVASSNSLDAAYPAGTYTFNLNGTTTVSLNLSPLEYPPAPHFLHDPAVRVPHDQGNFIGWERWSGSTANDFVQLRIRNAGTNVWETPDFGAEGALTGESTNAFIPANVLSRGVTYSARLFFRRTTEVNTNSYPGATALAYYFAETQIALRTIRPDIEEYDIEKGRNFFQTSPTNVVPEPGTEFQFSAQVQGSSTGLLTSASLVVPTMPVQTTLRLTNDSSFERFGRSDDLTTNTVFEATYPSGLYTFTVGTRNDGTQSMVLNVPTAAYPPAPRVSNFIFSTNNPILAGPPIVLQWDPWAGGTSNDFVQVQIRDAGAAVFETPDFGDEGALNGLSTNAVVPAGLVLPGKNYGGRVTFRRFAVIDETTPGTVGTVSFYSRTKFDITTLDPDARRYSLFKGKEYGQTSTNEPTILGYVFAATVTAQSETNLAWATITPPGGVPLDLSPDDDNIVFSRIEGFATQEELDAAYPDGAYRLDMLGLFYGQTNVILYLTNSAYPNPPRIANHESAGRITASAPFTLSWDRFTNGSILDYITNSLVLPGGGTNNAFFSPPPENPAALNGERTSVEIRANTLVGNRLYDGTLRFEKVLLDDDTTFVEVPGRVGYYAQTGFRAATQGQGNPPQLIANSFEFLPGNQLQVVMGTMPLALYTIEGSTNLVNWQTLTNFTATDERSTNTVPQPLGPTFFIRASFTR
jgi:hypothetical protein